jgi:thiamine biosynthesis lipoprotein
MIEGMIPTGDEHERRFDLFGSHVRLLIGEPLHAGLPSPEAMGVQIEFFLRLLHKKLTRFDPSSELCTLNADPHHARAVSPTLASAVGAALWAARRSQGLIDPTLLTELEDAGYATSRAGLPPASLEEALLAAPVRSPAAPRRDRPWAEIEVSSETCVVTRPPGTRIDSGGTGKGLAADLAAERLAGYASFVVDAGGDVRLGGERPPRRLVRIDHPTSDQPAHQLSLERRAVATSGIKTRLWRQGDGFAHHLLDPSTGDPAWTGVIQATSLGGTALEAETLAKMAYLAGPEQAARILTERGGLIVRDDGSVESFGALASSPRPEPVLAA